MRIFTDPNHQSPAQKSEEIIIAVHILSALYNELKRPMTTTQMDESIAGPGSYDYCENLMGKKVNVSSFSNMPQYSFVRERIKSKEPLSRNKSQEMTDISPNKLSIMKASPKCVIGSSRKFDPVSSINIPVSYGNENDKQLRMSMGVIGKEKRFSNKDPSTPGPARYAVEFHKAICKFMRNSKTTSTFGKAIKYSKDRSQSPGPGRYNIDAFKSLRMSFTKAKRLPEPSLVLPGPASYSKVDVSKFRTSTNYRYSFGNSIRRISFKKLAVAANTFHRICRKRK